MADRDDITRVDDGTSGDEVTPLVDSVPGTSRLAPYAGAVVSVKGSAVRVWADGGPEVLEGIEGTPQTAGWLDEDHALVTSAEGTGTVVYVCPVAEDGCSPVVSSEEDVRLGP